jgi:hypothetical protein
MPGYRQEVFNVLLAQLLQTRGIVSAPEQILHVKGQGRKMPDVIVNFNGLRTAIEGEIGYRANAHQLALQSARQRVEQGIAHIGIAVVYPEQLTTLDFAALQAQFATSEFEIAIISESEETGFVKGNVDYLQSALRRTFDRLVQEDVVKQAVAAIEAAVDTFAGTIAAKQGNIKRIAQSLGIRELPKQKHTDSNLKVAQISGLVLMNAMIFQEMLATSHTDVHPLSMILDAPDTSQRFVDHWQFIIDDVNYYSIFHLARALLLKTAASAQVTNALKGLARTAHQIVGKGAALRHDLMGRIYHRLLTDAKYLGTYYTSIPAATLLLKLTLRPDYWATSWQHVEQIRTLRISDLSCGTGTLLMAAADAITDNHIEATVATDHTIEMNILQQVLAEDVLYGYDVLPSALHLTASTLALRTVDVPFRHMNLFCLPLGGKDLRLGSVEFLDAGTLQMSYDLFGAHITAETQQKIGTAPIPMLDVCVMNPPFTRSVGGNLLFGSVPEKERNAMQKKLKELLKNPNILANATAGLGAVFVAAADPYIRAGGRIALVLPKALLSGPAWKKTRMLLLKNYQMEYIVASHDAERWNFSESTDLSEVLLVARKKGESNESEDQKPVVIVNLWRNPTTSFEALAVAQAVLTGTPPDVADGQGALTCTLGEQKFGEVVSLPWEHFTKDLNWAFPCNFAQADVQRVAYHLKQGTLWLPGHGHVGKIPLCVLSDLGSLGPDRRDIHDGFDHTPSVTPYPAFWGHDAKSVVSLTQDPNHYLAPLAKAKPKRNLRKLEDLWPLAGKVLIAERMRLNTYRLSTLFLTRPVLSNVYWTFSPKEIDSSDYVEKAIVLWLNSTLGFISLLSFRSETEGAWIAFKKPNLSAMPVLDLRALSVEQLETFSATFDRLCHHTLQPFPQMHLDPVRAEIDQVIAETFGLPDFSILRTLLAQEPVVCMKRIG